MDPKEAPFRHIAERDLTDESELETDEAIRGDPGLLSGAGQRADPYDEDLSGSPPLEDEPTADDILPDQIKRFESASEAEDEEREITAQPKETARH